MLEFEKEVINCPECGEYQDVLVYNYYDTEEEDWVSELDGGCHKCTDCGHIIIDEEVGW